MKQRFPWIIGLAGLVLFVVAAYQMSALPLWGYWPMALGIGLLLGVVPLLHLHLSGKEILLGATTGVLLSLGFYEGGSFLIFVSWVPILCVLEWRLQRGASTRTTWALLFWMLLIWNVGATFWVMNTALAAGIFANVVNALLMTLPLTAFFLVKKHFDARYHWISWVGLWLAFEFFHYHWDLHWPWLTLGNALASVPSLIQWYEITGVLGGSLWILLTNWLGFRAWSARGAVRRNYLIGFFALLIAMVALSLFWSPPEHSKNPSINVAIVQPNFEPHYEKFEYSEREQIDRIHGLIRGTITDKTDLLLLPETVFDIRMNQMDEEASIRMLRALQMEFPNMDIMLGVTTRRILEEEEESTHFTRTTTFRNGRQVRWEAGNAALYLSKEGGEEFYFKSKLVPGAEFFPYYRVLFFFEGIVDQLGGSLKGFVRQKEVSVFEGEAYRLAPIICYESIFGDYCRRYVAKGANLFAIITNDGWWDATPGHRQHLNYARLRAIEQRKAIARAANTGISGIVLPDGSIHQATEYEETISFSATLPLMEGPTFYTRWGDLIGRFSLFIVIVLLLQGLYLAFAGYTGKRGFGR